MQGGGYVIWYIIFILNIDFGINFSNIFVKKKD